MKSSKNITSALSKIKKDQVYNLEEAVILLKEITFTKFDSSIDVDICLGVDPKKADQMVRGNVTLPHGSGKETRVLVLCTPEKEEEAKAAGADYYGLDEYISKIEKGWTDIEVIVATPNVMPKIGKLGKVLGPRNLMPNPKTGTVTENIGSVVKQIKKGKISYKVDKYGIIHQSIGRISFTEKQIFENTVELIQDILKSKPSSVKGNYMKNIYISSTMSPSILIDSKSLNKA